MFNEGLDIKSIDMVMFLRPTRKSNCIFTTIQEEVLREKDKNASAFGRSAGTK